MKPLENTYLTKARKEAYLLAVCSPDRTTDASEVREAMGGNGFGNWMGALFQTDDWKPAGFKKASHPSARSRIIRRWKLA